MEEAERNKKLEELFGMASELPAGERDAFLARHCQGDAELESQLRVLLRQGDRPTATVLRGTAEPESGDRIGRYKLVKLLGAGGMGSVYLANQEEPVQRLVALKMIHPGMSSEEVVRRFDLERQTLALMDHPCIATIYDGGTADSGQPYLVMEYVNGLSITEYCDRHHLGTSARLELFCRVCDAVQHAHQKAIIHRDLKPGNVLVTEQSGEPVPKIIDFGIARAVAPRAGDRARSTTAGGVVGTMLYMSPEQADPRGTELDTRTDIYSLGVILYELLTGTTPFDPEALEERGWVEAQRILCEQDPPVPSARVTQLDSTPPVTAKRAASERSLPRALKGDLDWITMKAMEKDRNRRYGSAADLSADIERYLCDEPVLAGPPTVSYRSRKFVRRHRVAVSVSSIVVLTLVGSVVVTGKSWMEASEARTRAERNLEETKAVVEFLDWGLFHGDPVMTGGHELTVRGMLDVSAPELQEMFAGRPTGKAAVMSLVGRANLQLGEFELARDALRQAYALQLQVDAPKYERWVTLDHLISAVTLTTGRAAAAVYIQECVNLAVDILDDGHPQLRDSLVELLELSKMPQLTGAETQRRLDAVMDAFDKISEKDRERSLRMFGRIVGSVGWQLMARQDKSDAQMYFDRLETRVRALLDNDSLEFLTILGMFADLCLQQGNLKKALELATELTERGQALLPPRHWLYFEGDRVRGLALAAQGDFAEAEKILTRVYDGIERLGGQKTQRLRESEQGLARMCVWLRDKGDLASFLEGSWQRYAEGTATQPDPLIWWPVDPNLDLCHEAATAALVVLRAAIARDDDDARALGSLALAEFGANQKSDASKTFARFERAVQSSSGARAEGDRALLARVSAILRD